MAVREHTFVGTQANPITSTIAGAPGDDDGAPPAMPSNGRVTTVGGDGEVVADSTFPRDADDLIAKREAAAAKMAAPKARQRPTPEDPHPIMMAAGDPRTAIRLRCLELSARSGEVDPAKIIADARALLDFVENG